MPVAASLAGALVTFGNAMLPLAPLEPLHLASGALLPEDALLAGFVVPRPPGFPLPWTVHSPADPLLPEPMRLSVRAERVVTQCLWLAGLPSAPLVFDTVRGQFAAHPGPWVPPQFLPFAFQPDKNESNAPLPSPSPSLWDAQQLQYQKKQKLGI